jgi:hypothetical protein
LKVLREALHDGNAVECRLPEGIVAARLGGMLSTAAARVRCFSLD